MVKAGRYVQGGSALTVGVAGLVMGGGFSNLSKGFGLAAASLLEAEVVTADGDVKLANACANPDLFWALKGGGSGFGVETRLTLRTHDLPGFVGGVFVTVDALVAAATHWEVELQFDKGLAGGRPEAIHAAKNTAINPAVGDAFAMAICAAGEAPTYPGWPGHEPDVEKARRAAAAVTAAMGELRKLVTRPASYVWETDYFEAKWQDSFWGDNYPRLKRVKQRYDPDGLFFLHHGVGSEDWSADGFTRVGVR